MADWPVGAVPAAQRRRAFDPQHLQYHVALEASRLQLARAVAERQAVAVVGLPQQSVMRR